MLMLDAAVWSAIGGHDADANKLLFSISLDPSLPPTHRPSFRMTRIDGSAISSHPLSEDGGWVGAKGQIACIRSCGPKPQLAPPSIRDGLTRRRDRVNQAFRPQS